MRFCFALESEGKARLSKGFGSEDVVSEHSGANPKRNERVLLITYKRRRIARVKLGKIVL